MPLYVITGDKVTAFATEPADLPEGSLVVRSAADLAKADLPAARLVALWNALPGAKKITKFTDRATAARRLWAAFEKLPLADGASVTPVAIKIRAQDRKRSADAARGPAPKSKQAKLIALLKRPGGATLDALTEATGWQRHSVRGVISGALKKRLGLTIVTTATKGGARVYRIAGAGR